jgi:tetratricopeptide (TPR) repeat protein
MKVAHLDAEPKLDGSIRELLEDGRMFESRREYEKAIKVYNAVLKKDKRNETAYTRLMIVSRKSKDYAEELRVINQALEAFEADDIKNKKEHSGNIEKLSLSLGKLTGLIDRKGKSLYDPEPVATWKKRKLMVQKRLSPKPKKATKATKSTQSKTEPTRKNIADKKSKTKKK